jgi:hypothetical protein
MGGHPPNHLFLQAVLRACVCGLPDQLVASEAWVPSARGDGEMELSAFFTPTPLRTSLPRPGGAPPLYATVDLPLVREHSAKHQLATAIAARAAATGLLQYSVDIRADEMLRKLTFGVDTAVAMPLMEGTPGGRCEAVLVLFTFRGGSSGGGVSWNLWDGLALRDYYSPPLPRPRARPL